METLEFQCRGEWWHCDKEGQFIILRNHEIKGVSYWKFLGVSTHHWHNRIIYTFKEIWENPELAKKGIVWDYDHGTTRVWGGSYLGKLPRIESCYKTKGE